ncbi:MAG: hypothetical protein LBQ28_01950 [Prevotellaceae bacterium]|nr:hypothetical protein [Prevotellaceae bacterium]
MDTYPIAAQSLEKYYHVNGLQLERHYKEHLSDYTNWPEKEHAEEWQVFPENIGKNLSIDETSLSNGELYTIVTNKAAKGKKGALVALVEGTSSEKVIEALEKIPQVSGTHFGKCTLPIAGMPLMLKRKAGKKPN